MLDKDYLDKLKEEDYIAWDSLVNDPYLVGTETGNGGLWGILIFLFVVVIGILGVIIF